MASRKEFVSIWKFKMKKFLALDYFFLWIKKKDSDRCHHGDPFIVVHRAVPVDISVPAMIRSDCQIVRSLSQFPNQWSIILLPDHLVNLRVFELFPKVGHDVSQLHRGNYPEKSISNPLNGQQQNTFKHSASSWKNFQFDGFSFRF